MPGATRRGADLDRGFRDPPQQPQRQFPFIMPRQINIVWASIVDGDLLPGELVFNTNDNSLVLREDDNDIHRYDVGASRTI